MTIKEYFEFVYNSPKRINIINSEDRHIWIGDYDRAPDEIRNLEISKVSLHLGDHSDCPQTVFYI